MNWLHHHLSTVAVVAAAACTEVAIILHRSGVLS